MISSPDLTEPVELLVVDDANDVDVALERNLGALLLHRLNPAILVQVQILLVHLGLFGFKCYFGIHLAGTFSHNTLILCFNLNLINSIRVHIY